MAYQLYITRRKFRYDDGDDIPAEEWLRFVQSDPELRHMPELGKYYARGCGRSRNPEPWLDWFDGNIYSKGPDEAILGKMLQIAAALNAKVQGDSEEIYRSASFDDCFHPDDA